MQYTSRIAFPIVCHIFLEFRDLVHILLDLKIYIMQLPEQVDVF